MLKPDPVVIAIMPAWQEGQQKLRGKVKTLLGFAYSQAENNGNFASVEFASTVSDGVQKMWIARAAGKEIAAVVVDESIRVDKKLASEFMKARGVSKAVAVLGYLREHHMPPQSRAQMLVSSGQRDLGKSELPAFVNGYMNCDADQTQASLTTTCGPK